MNIIFFDGEQHQSLWPLTYIRPVSELRVGILTLKEKWEKRVPGVFSWKTTDYLQQKYPLQIAKSNLLINASVCATDGLANLVVKLKEGEGLRYKKQMVAVCLSHSGIEAWAQDEAQVKWSEYSGDIKSICFPWDIHEQNAKQIQADFDLLTLGRKSQQISKTNQIINPQNIFIEEGARIEFATINANAGPVYIGHNAEVMEGALIRGSLALCDHSVINMGSKIYGATTIGPYSKVGGEVSQSVILGYSNKGHDGFLGHSVLGEWCNLGAGTNVSNLKNNYEHVKVWSYPKKRFLQTGLQFGGLIMGDHSKAGISSMFNTGTVVGVACNIHGTGFPRQFVPSFADGGAGGYKLNQLKSVFSIAEKVMARRKKELSEFDREILRSVFELSSGYRKF